MSRGIFLISLDFELFWGVRDCYLHEQYDTPVEAVHQILPRLVNTFESYNIHATFATVGMLMSKNKAELEQYSPVHTPTYSNGNLSPYNGYLKQINESNANIHFAPGLVNCIVNSNHQELGTHTFSHYYCLENGQTAAQFEEDLLAAISIARSKGIELKTLVFPRNQYNSEYLEICKKHGIIAFRGNEKSWMYHPRNYTAETSLRRAFRLMDSYLNLTGMHTYKIEDSVKTKPYNFRSSRFLRPYNPSLRFLESLRLKRIKDAMTHAAKTGSVYHLWWHPHNFGNHTEANFRFLEKILQHYKKLENEYGFTSLSMAELAQQIEHS